MINLSIKGRYQDTIISESDNGFVERTDLGWKNNQVQDSALKILAHGLEKDGGNFTDYFPLTHMAVGTGTPSSQPYTQELLENEVERIQLPSFIYLDSDGNELSPQVPSNKFKFVVTLGAANASGHTLTEFGLVGGNTTEDSDTGYLFNWVLHDPIEKTPLVTIERTIEITINITRN